jgi:hypothetical protein
MILRIVSSSAVVLLLFVGAVWAKPDGAAIYADLCASCHAETRLGAQGPALIPESLGRLKGDKLAAVIAEGRPMTQMPAFRDTADARGHRRRCRLRLDPDPDAGLGRGRDRRLARPARRLHPRHSAGVRRRSDEHHAGGGNRRQPYLGAGRRQLCRAGPVRDPLCRAWRAEVQFRRALCLRHVARWLGAEIRYLVAARGGPRARRAEQPQHRDEFGRQVPGRGQLSARHPDHPERRPT